jgi:hypothetical protein
MSIRDATPQTPHGQFAVRYNNGVGVRHRGAGVPPNVNMFGNLGNEVMNFREFVTHNLDFHEADDIAVTRWTVTQLTGVAGTFTRVDDTPQGLAVLDVGGATEDHGVQIQETVATAQGEMYFPTAAQSKIVAWEARGSMDFAEDCTWYIGIGETDATFQTSAAGAITADNFIGFSHFAGATTVNLIQGGTAAANVVTITPRRTLWIPADAIDTKRRLGVRIEDNNEMFWYVDGVLVGHTYVGDTAVATGTATVAFDDAMCSTFCLINGDGGQATMTIDYIASQVTRV